MRVEQEQGSSVAAIIDKVAVVGFGVCWSLLLFAFVVSAGPVAALGWLLALALPSVLMVDLAAGLVHWFADTFLTPRTPWIGPTVIQSFREHHLDPAALARRDAVEASGCADLLCDASRNSNMAYHDVVRLRLCNNTRAHAAGDNPLDGAKKADRYMS